MNTAGNRHRRVCGVTIDNHEIACGWQPIQVPIRGGSPGTAGIGIPDQYRAIGERLQRQYLGVVLGVVWRANGGVDIAKGSGERAASFQNIKSAQPCERGEIRTMGNIGSAARLQRDIAGDIDRAIASTMRIAVKFKVTDAGAR